MLHYKQAPCIKLTLPCGSPCAVNEGTSSLGWKATAMLSKTMLACPRLCCAVN